MKSIVIYFIFFSIIFLDLEGAYCYKNLSFENYLKQERSYSYTHSNLFQNQKQLRDLINEIDAKTVVEIGCWLGESTAFICECLPESGTVFAVDSWIGYPQEVYQETHHVYERFLSNLALRGQIRKVTPIRSTSITAAKKFKHYLTGVDLIYIDGDHSFEAVYSDLKMWSKNLNSKGVLCGNCFTHQTSSEEILRAVEAFCQDIGGTFNREGYFWRIYF